MRAAQSMKGQAAGVVVFTVSGDCDADYWSEPVLLAQAGDVPAEAQNSRWF